MRCAGEWSPDGVVVPPVIDFAFPQSLAQHCHILAQVLQRSLHGDAIYSLDSLAMARSDAKPQPCGSKVAECQCLLRQGQWMARIGGHNGRSQSHRSGSHKCGGKDGQAIRCRCSLGHPDLFYTSIFGGYDSGYYCQCICSKDGQPDPLSC